MAQWTRVQQLREDALQQVVSIYGENFPVEVRYAVAHWIEEQNWNDLDPDNSQHNSRAAQFFNNLIQQVEMKATTADNFVIRLKLNEAVKNFRQKYSNNPQNLVRTLKHCLQTEQRIIQEEECIENLCNSLPSPMQINPDPGHEISLTLNNLRHKTQEITEEIRIMKQQEEAFVIQYQENARRQALLQQQSSTPEIADRLQQERTSFEKAVREKIVKLVQVRIKIVQKQESTFEELSNIQKRILDTELINWKRGQQLVGNGVPFENNLNQIQAWCEDLCDIILKNRQEIKNVERLFLQVPLNMPGDTKTKLPMLYNQITSLLSTLIASTFIVEKQPPQVIKTATKFAATVRLLVGSKLGVCMTPPEVKVTILSEAQTIAHCQNDNLGSSETSGEILNNIGTMEYHQDTRQLSVNFRNMQLRKFKRPGKKGFESVMDEKFSILFQSQFNVTDLAFQVWTLSLPVVIIVHGSQEPHAWATVIWDNAFAEPGRIPFEVPDSVPWSNMAEVLSNKFKDATGRELMAENLQFLAGKILSKGAQNHNNTLISWSQFCKEFLPDRSFTFWEWFYAIMKTTREYLRDLWKDGLILGFVSRHQTEEMLNKKVSGTFLLRFSDSELGGVSIAWASQQRDGSVEVLMVQPFTSRDFQIRSLADRIGDLKNLLYLYPDIPKDQAFGKYYSPLTENSSSSTNGYIKPKLVIQIPGVSEHGMDSYPNTPQPLLQSPDPGYQDMQSPNMLSLSEYLLDMEDVDFSNINVTDLVPFSSASN